MLIKQFKLLQNIFLSVLSVLYFSSCAHQTKSSIDSYSEFQNEKVTQGHAYEDAELIFWTSVYRPTKEDIQELRRVWIEHAGAFPESNSIKQIDESLNQSRSRFLVVSLFAPEYESADLKNKNFGWAVSPAPQMITELEEKDLPLRTLMPVKNDWARYYLLKYDANNSASMITISKRSFKVDLHVK